MEKWRKIVKVLFIAGKIVLTIELFDPAGSIDYLLFACIKGMADITDIDVQ